MKKGYFFTLDAFMAMAILVICVVLIFSINSSKPYPLQSIFLSDDVMYYLSNTKIYELQNPLVASMVGDGNITMTENSLVEQVAVFYISNRTGQAQAFLMNVTQNLVPNKYGFMLKIYNSTSVYNVTVNSGQSSQDDSRLIITSKRILFGVVNDTSWGPMTAEVRLWQ